SADVGIALGVGAAQANEVAGVTLMGGDLRRLPDAVALAKMALRTVRANVAFSIAVKLLVFGLVLLGSGTMWLAVLADVGTTLMVTLNGMRLLNWKAAGG
ncbi:MAG TPA: heavy metal translocating P-type ATPase, partial [Anaerolineales bacterium]|nr:heavy metal translocating P-type ATPase [Anaerolineales bacterium]